MNTYISELPKELQERLLYEIPSYGQLSRHITAGRHYYLHHLCQKDITQNEFLNYLKKVNPDRAYIYIDGLTQYIIVELIFKFNRYVINASILDFDDQIKITSKTSLPLETYLKIPHVTFSYDLITTEYIYNQRNQCHYLKNYLFDQYHKHIHQQGETDFEQLVNQIKMVYYIISNKKLMFYYNYNTTELTVNIMNHLKNLFFDHFEYIGDIDELNEFYSYLNTIYENNITFLIDYLNK